MNRLFILHMDEIAKLLEKKISFINIFKQVLFPKYSLTKNSERKVFWICIYTIFFIPKESRIREFLFLKHSLRRFTYLFFNVLYSFNKNCFFSANNLKNRRMPHFHNFKKEYIKDNFIFKKENAVKNHTYLKFTKF